MKGCNTVLETLRDTKNAQKEGNNKLDLMRVFTNQEVTTDCI